MKIMVLKESGRGQGQVRTISVRPVYLLIPVLAAAALLFTVSVSSPSLSAYTSNHQDLVAEWQARLAAQQTEIEALQQRSATESQAVGRQLAAMQARLLRMEALGSRVTEIAKLDGGEFSFDEPTPVGGPTMAVQSPIAWSELQSSLTDLSMQLRNRESELEVLDSLLRNQEFQQTTAVSGRPVTWGWMSSPFGKRVDPFSGQNAWHAGVDFAGRRGSDVIAVASGVVTFAGRAPATARWSRSTTGTATSPVTAITKASGSPPATSSRKAKPSAPWGLPGAPPVPHVHFEVLKNGKPWIPGVRRPPLTARV
jgi:murein DD-endopeptidase MepM/ murein hydrolase activator NlpD